MRPGGAVHVLDVISLLRRRLCDTCKAAAAKVCLATRRGMTLWLRSSPDAREQVEGAQLIGSTVLIQGLVRSPEFNGQPLDIKGLPSSPKAAP